MSKPKKKAKHKPCKRTFYKYTIRVTILTEDPIPDDMGIGDMIDEMNSGAYTGTWHMVQTEQQGAKDMAAEMRRVGSDPDFFSIDDDGNIVGDSEDSDDLIIAEDDDT